VAVSALPRAAFLVLGACALPTCKRAEPPPPLAARAPDSAAPEAPGAESGEPPAPEPAAASEVEKLGLAPLAPGEEFSALEVEGFARAVVSLPTGATTPRPVAVALHGNFDRPEWQCEVWRGVFGARGFIVCPRGIARRDVPKSADRWEYASGKAVEQEILASLAALSRRFGAHVAEGPVVFIGFSLGAIYGSPLVQKQPERFPRVVLIEGGQKAWTRFTAAKFAKGGGLRLFIGCGQAGCLDQAKRLGPALEKAGLPTRSGGSRTAGHTYDGPIAQALSSELEWLLEGDPRWQP